MTKLTAPQWDVHWVPSLQIYLWVIMKEIGFSKLTQVKHGLLNTNVFSRPCVKYFYIGVMQMIFFAFLKMRSMLNTKHHHNIRLTMGKETKKFFPFLNVLVKNEGRKFFSSVYRKKTPTGIFTQYNSFTPFNCKIVLIKCLIYRAFKISSSGAQLEEAKGAKAAFQILVKYCVFIAALSILY